MGVNKSWPPTVRTNKSPVDTGAAQAAAHPCESAGRSRMQMNQGGGLMMDRVGGENDDDRRQRRTESIFSRNKAVIK